MTTDHWTFDRRIPIGIIATVLLQSAALVWWARGVVADIDAVRSDKAQLQRRVTAIEDRTERERLSERMAVMEAQMRLQTDLLMRIEHRLSGRAER